VSASVPASKSKRTLRSFSSQNAQSRVLVASKVGQYQYAVPHDPPASVPASVTRRMVVPNVGSTNVPPAARSKGNDGGGKSMIRRFDSR
jgi:hypothetical protein